MKYDELDFCRIIEFRAWSIKGKQMIMDIQKMYDGLGDWYDNNGKEIDPYKNFEVSSFYGNFNKHDTIIMQYTGFKDNNEVKIYEGDICEYTTNEKIGLDLKVFKGFVRFNDGRFEIGFHNGYGGEWQGLSYLLGNYSKGATSFKVVGNVFNLTKK